jgi:indole-3-glycerol phosphate synthase
MEEKHKKNFLERMVEQKRGEIPRLRRERALSSDPPRPHSNPSFLSAFTKGPLPRIIAEVKRASPSKGALNPGLDPVNQAKLYQRGEAKAISVLTDAHFQGTLNDLEAVAAAVDLPILRKDFILDSIQLKESLVAGASAVLLIAAILSPNELKELVEKSLELGLEPLVEVHIRDEMEKVLATPARIIGINNRDLETFQVDLEVAETLAPLVAKDRVVVAESGISTREDVERLMAVGVENFLVGEALVRADDPREKLRELMGHG